MSIRFTNHINEKCPDSPEQIFISQLTKLQLVYRHRRY
jgi:hypothetical protein